MKKLILNPLQFTGIIALLLFLFSSTMHAQVAIGNDTPAPGTLLDVDDGSGTKGVLFPKVNLINVNITAPLPNTIPEGTFVYNTNPTITEGYYYWTGGSWIKMESKVGTMAKFTNSISDSSSNNFNTGSNEAQLLGNVEYNDNSILYSNPGTPTNTRVTIAEAGRYKITVNLSLVGYSSNSNQALLAVEAQYKINNGRRGTIYRSSEMISRDSSTPDYGSISFTEIMQLRANDQLSVQITRSEQAGRVHLRSNETSSFFIEKIN